MLPHGFTAEPTLAESVVLEALADIFVDRLCAAEAGQTAEIAVGRASPVLIHVDGPGRTTFLNEVESKLEVGCSDRRPQSDDQSPPWTVVRFDAWQHQRVPPPWWWLIRAIDTELRSRPHGWRARLSQRLVDWRWRARLLVKDVFLVLLAVVLAAVIAALAWMLSGKSALLDVVQWAAAVLAALTAVVGFAWSGAKALGRHLLVESPAGASAVLRLSDPMAELKRRYEFLVGSAGSSVAILIDNLDRCRADYVVELLEGVQTLLKQSRSDTKELGPMVVYVVAADGNWMCESYLHVYQEFQETAHEPGRPFGLAFLDKIFDLSVRIPSVPTSVSLSEDATRELTEYLDDPTAFPGTDEINRAGGELAIRAALYKVECGSTADPESQQQPVPCHGLRLCAVRRLAALENAPNSGACPDTDDALLELAKCLEPSPIVARHLHSAYRVERTVQLLGGHSVDCERQAISRLGLWTILKLRWPLLAEDLEQYPSHLTAIGQGPAPSEVDEQLAPVFRLPEVQRFAKLAEEFDLHAEELERFTRPIAPQLSGQGDREADEGTRTLDLLHGKQTL
jgi:hypothetical protein